MADIFMSYANEDLEHAERLARALTEQGWTVWWDRRLSAGQVFEEVIEQAIDSARCVVVLWSKASVGSRWVRAEANEGAERGILVPVRLDGSRIPLAFRQLHTADLTGWRGDLDAGEILELSDSISRITGHSRDHGRDNVVSIKSRAIRVESVATTGRVPDDVDAIVMEQDTGMVLGPLDDIRDSRESMESLAKALSGSGEAEQGSVIVLGTVPSRLLAIIHDLDRDPTWTEDIVAKTVARVLELSNKRGFASIAMPLLGAVHGGMTEDRARQILDDAVSNMAGPGSLRTIWLVGSQPG